ncbi:MAG: hypothetical protein KKA19_01825 [Candidatus Margulisbacteria bacterium]|nr:hypothetical protein [Candidatus Margulisiibacteriota bacterium]
MNLKIDLAQAQNLKVICLPRADVPTFKKRTPKEQKEMAIYIDASQFTKGNHDYLC